jgi:hypothetical protein
MGTWSFEELYPHIGHDIVCVIYGDQNVAIECETCMCVLVDFDREEDYFEEKEEWNF